MQVAEELSRFASSEATFLTIGVFDGVHLGHRHLLTRLIEEARRHNCRAGVVTFSNHPRTVLQLDAKVTYLITLEERIRLMRSLGIGLVVPLTFTEELSRLRAREFVEVLQRHLKMRGLVVGPDFAMGYKREGDINTLTTLGKEIGFAVKVVEPVTSSQMQISSTAIRQALVQGDVSAAACMLGRNFSLEGLVTHGAGRGHTLGFPTANLAINPDLAIPADGVYATWAYVDRERYQSATNIGMRPTFGPGERAIETFIFDYRGDDLRGRALRLEFVRRLREERRFANPEALGEQISLDVTQSRSVLAAEGKNLSWTRTP